MMTVQIFILCLLYGAIYRHHLMSLNMRRYIRMHEFFQVDLYKKMNRAIYQKKRQFACTFFLVHLPYSINEAIRIHVLYHPWHHHYIICVMNMRQNISSSVCKNLFWEYIMKFGCTYAVIFLWDVTEKKISY